MLLERESVLSALLISCNAPQGHSPQNNKNEQGYELRIRTLDEEDKGTRHVNSKLPFFHSRPPQRRQTPVPTLFPTLSSSFP